MLSAPRVSATRASSATPRSRNELLTTNTELAAMAAAATTGSNHPNAANGIPTTLYANAHPKF